MLFFYLLLLSLVLELLGHVLLLFLESVLLKYVTGFVLKLLQIENLHNMRIRNRSLLLIRKVIVLDIDSKQLVIFLDDLLASEL